ncbi:MAG: sulfatase-like hydrolase/transferase [Candidatus Margulisiibacteriota bacterium]
MKKIVWKLAVALFLALAFIFLAQSSKLDAAQKKKPNILFILTDNQSSNMVGAYGNKAFNTPNMDRLASEGIWFNQAYATHGMSSPTRASILTGLMPSQHGVHFALADDPKTLAEWPQDWSAIEEFRNLPQTLHDAGYTTALIGKYHLGLPWKSQLEFDYWLTFPAGHTKSFYGMQIIDNGKRYVYPGHVTEFWTKRAVEYIKSHKDSEKPFFLYLTYNGPYNIPPAMLYDPPNEYDKDYEGKEEALSPREPIADILLEAAGRFAPDAPAMEIFHPDKDTLPWGAIKAVNSKYTIRRVAAEVTKVDTGIGQVMAALKESGLDENTLVIFSSDQGVATGQNGLWCQSYVTWPSNLYDFQVRIPLAFRQTGTIKPGQKLDQLVSEVDFLPTILDYVGLGDLKIDNTSGKSYASLLRGEKNGWTDRDAVFFEEEQSRAIRTPEWMYCRRFTGTGSEELYDMKKDPGQKHNLAVDSKYLSIKKELEARLDAFFAQYADPKYDLWKGGTVKSSTAFWDWKNIWPNWAPVTKKVKKPFSDLNP